MDSTKPSIDTTTYPEEETAIQNGESVTITIIPTEDVEIDETKFIPIDEEGNPIDATVMVNKDETGIHIQIIGGEEEGNIYIQIEEGGITDKTGNTNEEIIMDTKVSIDNTAPTISVEKPAVGTILQKGETIQLVMTPSEMVTIDESKITVQGVTDATVQIAQQEEIVTVTITAGEETADITIQIAEGAFTDTAGNKSVAQTITGYSIDNTAPDIHSFQVTSVTQTTITVKVQAEDRGAAGLATKGTYEYHISTSPQFANEDVVIRTDNTYTFDPLQANMTYYIKVLVKDEKGNVATSEVLTTSTDSLPEGEVAIQFTNITWENESASVIIQKQASAADYTVEYQIIDANGDTLLDWTEAEDSQVVDHLLHGYIVHARVKDTQGNTGKITTASIFDNTAPSITLQEQEKTSNISVTITVHVEEKESGLGVQKYLEGKKTVQDFAEAGMVFTSNTIEVANNGPITVYAEDKAGNGQVATIIVTKLDREEPTITPSAIPTETTPAKTGDSLEMVFTPSEDVTVDKNKFVPVDEDGNPVDATVTVNKEEDGTICITVVVGEDEGEIYIEIQPGGITDEAGNTNKKETIPTKLVVDNTKPSTTIQIPADNAVIRKGETTTMTIVPTEDVTVDTSKIVATGDGVTGASTQIKVQEDGSITITITAGEGTGNVHVTIQEGAITDSAGNTNTEQVLKNIVAIDNSGPTVHIEIPETTTNSMRVTVDATDVGTAGLAQIDTYTYTISSSADFSKDVITKTTTQADITVGNLEDDTMYYAQVVVKDALGNATTSSIVYKSTGQLPEGDTSIVFGSVVWSDEQASMTIEKAETVDSQFLLQYRVVNQSGAVMIDWTEITEDTQNVTGLLHGYTVDARLLDATGNASGTKTYTIQDTKAPIITLTEPNEMTNGNVLITVTVREEESGVAVQKYTAGNQSTEYFLTAGTEFTGNTFEATSNGVWTVYIKDKAGNATIETITITKQDVDIPTIGDTSLPTEDTKVNKGTQTEIIVTPNEDVSISENKFLPVDENGNPIDATVDVTQEEDGTIHIVIIAGEDEGDIYLQIQSGAITDEAGNTNEETTIPTNITVDNTKPNLTVIQPDQENTIKQGETISITIQMYEDGTIHSDKITVTGEGAQKASIQVLDNDNGSATVIVTGGTGTGDIQIQMDEGAFVDKAGNSSEPKTVTGYSIDNSGPTISTLQIVEPMTTSSLSVSVIAEDVGAAGIAKTGGYIYHISKSEDFAEETIYTADTPTQTFKGLEDNTTYYIKIEVKDALGNVTESTAITGSTKPLPSGETSIVFSDITWKNEKASITVTKIGDTNDYTLQYQIKDAEDTILQDWTPIESNSQEIGDLLSGYKIMACLVDDNQNTGTVATASIIDKNSPTVTLEEQSTATQGNVTVTVNIVEAESGIAIQKYASGNQTTEYFQTAGNAFTGTSFIATANGVWTVYVEDKAGNITIETITITKQDTQEPTVENSQLPETTEPIQKGESIEIIITPSEDVTIDPTKFVPVDEAGNPIDASVEVTKDIDGSIHIEITAGDDEGTIGVEIQPGAITDEAGNTNEQQIITTNTTIDNTPPSTTVTTNADKSVIGNRETTAIVIQPTEEARVDTSKIVVGGNGSTGATIEATEEDDSIVITITGGTGTGDIDIILQPGAITDTAGNTNTEQTIRKVTTTDNTGPSVNLAVTNFNTNSITVQAIAEDIGTAGLAVANTYTYTLATNENLTTGVETKQTTATNVTFTGLKNNTTYYIQVVAIDKKDNEGTSNIVTQSTRQVPEGEAHITFGNVTWENESASVIISKNETVTEEFSLQYKVMQGDTIIQDWQTAPESSVEVTGLQQDYVVIARLVDIEENTNGSKSFTILDTTPPTILLTEQETVTNGNVTITVTITEKESGIEVQKYAAGNQTAEYFLTAGTEFTETTWEATSNGVWTVYVKDKAGNTTVQTITVTKQDTTPPAFSQIQIPTDATVITQGDTITVIVTPSKEVTLDTSKFTIVDTDGNPLDSTVEVSQADGVITVTITAGTIDGDIYLKIEQGAMIDKAGNDNEATTVTTNTSIDNTKPVIEVSTPAAQTVLGKKETTTIELTASEDVAINADNITLTGTGSEGANITATQADGKIILTITGGETTGNIDVELANGAFTDGVGNPSDKQSIITGIQVDASAPTVANLTAFERTTSTISVSLTATDVGPAGLPTEGAYTYIISTDENFAADVTWEFAGNTNAIQFKSLKANTTYYIKVMVKDTKGNIATSETIIAETTEIPTAQDTITFSDVTWVNHAGNVTVTKDTTVADYTLQYCVQNADETILIDWTSIQGNEVEVTGIPNGGKVLARLWDGTSGGSSKQKTVRDIQAPTFTQAEVEIDSDTGYYVTVNVSATDENGLSTTEPYVLYYRKTTQTDFTRYILTAETTDITSLLEENTTYILYMEANDYFGNVASTTEVEFTTAEAVAQIDSTRYDSLQRAMNAVPDGTTKTITMLKSVAQSGSLAANKTAILDLNNTTLTGRVLSSGNITIRKGNISPTDSSAIHVYEDGTVTVESTVTLTAVDVFPAVINFGTFYLNGGTAKSAYSTLMNYSDATMHINSGTVQTTAESLGTIQNNGTLYVKGGTITSGTAGAAIYTLAILEMTGGTINGTIGSGIGISTTGTANITGGTFQGSDDYPLIVNENELTINGSTVTLTGGSNLVNNKETGTAYLKNGAFHNTGNSNMVYNFGTVYVSGGSYVSDENMLFANEGTLHISGGTLTGSGGTAVYNLATGTANISGGTITSTCSGSNALMNYGKATISGSAKISGNTSLIINYSDTAQIDVTGGTITATGSNNAFHNLGTVNFSGATLTSQSSTALSSEKTLNIKGGNITSDYGNAVYTAATGVTTITGGTLKTTADFPVVANYGKTDITNSSVKITGSGNGIKNNSGGTVNVTAGTISTTSANVIYNLGTMTISGSTITGDGGTTIYNGGTMTTKGSMTASADTNAVGLNEGTWYIQGGTLSSNSTTKYAVVNYATINMSSGTIKGVVVPVANTYKFNLSGGTINCTTTGQGFQNESGATLEFTGGTISALSNQPLIGNSGTVNVRTNITRVESIVTNNATGTFNLISGTITCSGSGYYPLYNLGTMVLKGSTIKTTGITTVYNGKTFNASSGSITSTGGASAVVNAGTMTTSGSVKITSDGQALYNNGGTVNINGGTLTGTTNGSPTVYNVGGAVTLNGGTINHTVDYNYSVYSVNSGTYTYKSGTVGYVGNG